MADWKDSLNLPAYGLPDEGQPGGRRTGGPGPLGRDGPLRADPRSPRRPPEVRPARRSALRQRPDPSRHGAQQDPQGLRRQVPDHGRVRLPVRARLRLPRAAHRAEGRPRTGQEEAGHERGGFPPCLPRLRRALHRRDDERVPAPRRVRRLGSPLPDDGVQVPGGDCPGARHVRRAGAGVQGQEAGALVHSLPHRAGRSRGGVRGAHVAVDLRRVRAGARERGRAGRRGSRRWPAATSPC